MNPMTNVKNVQRMNQLELEKGLAGSKTSWHEQYKDSAWIFVGGLPYDLTEGDVLCVFSQYGEIVNINLVRDKTTGKTKGFCFICYEDQRSTILAVDNLNSIKLLNRTLRVDHVQDYKKPKETGDEDELTKMLREEGCGPKLEIPGAEEEEGEEEEEEELEIRTKKSKKEKKKKKKKEKKKKKKEKKKKQDSGESESSGSEASDSDVNSDSHKVHSVRIKKETEYDEYSNRAHENDSSPEVQRHAVRVKEERRSSDRLPDNRSERQRPYANERDSRERIRDRYNERTRDQDNYNDGRDRERERYRNRISGERNRDGFNDRSRSRDGYRDQRERVQNRDRYADRERERQNYRDGDRNQYRSYDRSSDRRDTHYYKDSARGSGRDGYRQNGGYRR